MFDTTRDHGKALEDLASALRIGAAFRVVETSSVLGSISGHPPPPSAKLGLSWRDNPFHQSPFKYNNISRKSRKLVQDEIFWRDFKSSLYSSEVKTRVGANMMLLKFVTSRIPNDNKLKRDAKIKQMGSHNREEEYIERALLRRRGVVAINGRPIKRFVS